MPIKEVVIEEDLINRGLNVSFNMKYKEKSCLKDFYHSLDQLFATGPQRWESSKKKDVYFIPGSKYWSGN